jgi:DNA-binding Lrp family transcriptional regulator
MTLDDTHRQLIALLRRDARLPMARLADALGVSRGTVANRLRKLENAQGVVGYTVQRQPEAQPDCIRARMWVLVDGNQSRAVIASLLGAPGAVSLPDTNGRRDLLAALRADSMAALSRLLERVRLTAGIRDTATRMLLSSDH